MKTFSFEVQTWNERLELFLELHFMFIKTEQGAKTFFVGEQVAHLRFQVLLGLKFMLPKHNWGLRPIFSL